ncbi:MAG TPA: divalent-cation tolerance protein CutA [Xanthobacteraceae bacterium]|nr:divalent-cation tolerance protein CutA [Xanthobacteraceae bacterium]
MRRSRTVDAAVGAPPSDGEEMERAVLVYTTYPSVVEAEQAGRAIVARRLAACVNILPGMVSHYWWQGAIERGEEAVMIIKTRAALAEEVRAAVKAGHSYTTPSILVLPIEGGDPGYLRWIFAATEGANSE